MGSFINLLQLYFDIRILNHQRYKLYAELAGRIGKLHRFKSLYLESGRGKLMYESILHFTIW